MEQIIFVILFFVGGIVSVIIGIRSYFERKRLFATGIRVDGHLEKITFTSDQGLELDITFKTLDDKQRCIRHRVDTPSEYSVGSKIAIIYDRHSPHKYLVDEGPYKPDGTYAIYGGAVLIMVGIIGMMTTLR